MSDNAFNSVFPNDDDNTTPRRDDLIPDPADSGESTDTPESAPAPAPRIVAETPLGGPTRTITAEETPEAEPEPGLTEPVAAEVDTAELDAVATEPDAVASEPDAVASEPDAVASEPDAVAAEPDAVAAEPDAVAAELDADSAAAMPGEAPEPEAGSTLERVFDRVAALVDAVIPDGDEEQAAEPPAADTAPAAPVDLAPAAIRSRAPEGTLAPEPLPDVTPVTNAKEWDDDLSPELAALLFAGGAQEAAPAPSAAPTPAPVKPAAATAEHAAVKVPSPELPPAELVELTRVEEARRLHLYAGGHSAPAPDAALAGKVRYTRLEEPLNKDRGQRVRETWSYYKPDYPGLAGRLVREVRSEEISYSDGSYHWRFERRYADKGTDKREVRANKDRTYIERADEVSVIDAATGKRQRHKLEARLIFAPPEEEKRGGFLSSLLGKDDDDDAARAPVWREAASKEARAARKAGGSAF